MALGKCREEFENTPNNGVQNINIQLVHLGRKSLKLIQKK